MNMAKATYPMIWRRLEELASVGLPLYVTELSLITSWDPVAGPINEMDEASQARHLEALVSLFYSHPAVAGVTLWGFWDGSVWVDGSGLWRLDWKPKPSAAALRALWREKYNTTLRSPAAAVSKELQWRGHYGRYAYELLDPRGRRHEGAFEVAPGRGSRAVTVQLAP
jgi:endo-1,4-beta-xylanase